MRLKGGQQIFPKIRNPFYFVRGGGVIILTLVPHYSHESQDVLHLQMRTHEDRHSS